ncbi:MAG: hypothetical protein KZQ92_10090, partial [Candidatus Thiodiazotropha sp. (ex Lucinoma borealis)]|nr:hypothetical protein [Candidatus Thiodiazotropha sp. (ex Lucinoma borealis)]
MAQGTALIVMTVVVALKEQAQCPWQWCQIDLLLVFVARNDMDRVAGVGTGDATALGGGTGAVAILGCRAHRTTLVIAVT